MKIKLTAFLILLSFSALTFAQFPKPTRVRFPNHSKTVTLTGILKGKKENLYLVSGRKGQRFRFELEVKENEYASMQVKSPSRKVAVSNDGTDAGFDWENRLEENGDYEIAVFPPDTADKTDLAHYKLKITLIR